MANQLTVNPWIIDTPGAGTLFAGANKIKSVRWVGATTAAHAAEIQDTAGNVRWSSVAAGANNLEIDEVSEQNYYTGIKVPTLQSGKLYIELAL